MWGGVADCLPQTPTKAIYMLKGLFWHDDIDAYYPGYQFEEIFKARIYAPYLEGKKDAVVLDIGANIGVFTLYTSKYASKVYSIEPDKGHFECLTHMVEFNDMKNVTPLNVGIANTDGKMSFFHNAVNKTMYSTIQTSLGVSETVEIDVITLETLFTQQKIDHVTLCKIDVEGLEQDIIGGAAFKNVAPKIDTVIVESHAWNGRHPNQLRAALELNGFTVSGIQNDATLFVGTK